MKLKAILMLLACMLFFTSCSYNLGIEGLMHPPKLTDEQEQIYTALIKATGKNITLKYPRTGDYRSAFVLVNIDDEPTEEALVFYEMSALTADDSALRINVLDKGENGWESVYDLAGLGTDVDRVVFSKLGTSSDISVIVGFTILSQAERALKIYSYNNGIMTEVHTDSYSAMDVVNIDSVDGNELLLIQNNAASETARAKLLRQSREGAFIAEESAMDASALDYTALLKGNLGNNTAIYVDSNRGANQIATEILVYKYSKLRNLLYGQEQNLSEKTLRPAGMASMDIDHDGVIEIPITSPFPGYETYTKNEQITATNWYTYEENDLVRKYHSYYNTSKGYVFMFPQRWQGTVTVKLDSDADELIFYKYEGEINDKMVELMRIRTGDKEKENSEELRKRGYKQIVTGRDYWVKLTKNDSEPLILTMSEVTFNFMLLY